MKARKQFAFVTFLLGLIAAVGGFLAWSLPARGAGPASGKGPRALLQIASHPPQLRFSNVDGHEDYRRYLETQTVLIRSKLVLTSALKRPAVSELPWIKQQSDPIAWLQQNLEAINLKESEVLQVSLRANSGASTEDQAAVINAVVRAYMDEVADVDTKQRSDRLGKLKRIKKDYGEMLKERRQYLRKLSERVGVDGPLASLDRQELSRLYHNLRTQSVNLRLERAEA
jgi:polysaccharide biosynthesis transport protein